MAGIDPTDLPAVQTALVSSSDRAAMEIARAVADLEQRAPTVISVRMGDKFYRNWMECGDYLELQLAWPRNKVQTGALLLKGDDPLAALALTCHQTTVPVVVEAGHLRWSGRVDVAHDKFGEDTPDTVECELLGDFAWLTRIIAWSNFLTPIIIQFPNRGTAIGGAVTVIKYIIATQTFRLQAGLWDLVNNLGNLNLDWRTWMGTALMQDLGDDGRIGMDDIMRMLRTPIYVIPTNPFLDTSPFVAVTWRFQKLSELIEQIVEDNGLSVEVNLWLPGDPQPHADILYPLTTATIVVDVKDRSGIVGPTGTFLDGILRVLVDLESSLFGQLLAPLLNPSRLGAPLGINIAPAIGVNFVQPWCLFNGDDVDSGIRGELVHHHPLAWRVIAGGRSPKWLNDLINATISWLLDMVMILIGITGIPSDLLNGIFNDAFFAFQLIDIMDRRIDLGPFGFPESFTPANTGTYQLSMIFILMRAIWDTRGYVSGRVVFDQNFPYTVGRDLWPGALATVIRRGAAYTDYIENITLKDTRTERVKITCEIGDNKDEEAPTAKLQRRIVGFQEGFNNLMLSIQS
jgi:hypothetical protein